MKTQRSTGIFLIVCAALCGVIAYECYRRAVNAGQALAELIQGLELESVAIPIETKVASFFGVILLVAGVICVFSHRDEQGDRETITAGNSKILEK